MADIVGLTVVGSQGESDVICALLRAHGIECGDRATDFSAASAAAATEVGEKCS